MPPACCPGPGKDIGRIPGLALMMGPRDQGCPMEHVRGAMMNRSNNQRGPRLPGGLESVPVTARRQDDIDGGAANETVRFGLGGADYEIDLSTQEHRRLRQAVRHRSSSMPARRGEFEGHAPARSAASRQRSGDIRAWGEYDRIGVQPARAYPRPAWWSNTRPRPKSLAKPATGARREPDAVPGPDSVRAVRVISQPIASQNRLCRTSRSASSAQAPARSVKPRRTAVIGNALPSRGRITLRDSSVSSGVLAAARSCCTRCHVPALSDAGAAGLHRAG